MSTTAAKPNAAEQMKQLAGALKKHHFWLLLVIAVIAAIVVWSMATGQLQQAFAFDQRKIEGTFVGVNNMPTPFRNQEMIGQIDAEQAKITRQAIEAWNVLYERQKPLLVWPKEVAAIAQIPLDQEIPLGLRSDFQQICLVREWHNVFLTAEPKDPKLDPMSTTQDPPAGYIEKLDWPSSDRLSILQRYQAETEAPTTVRVRTTMEDIWVYQNMVDVIRDMNKDARDAADATIKRIRTLDIAQWAINKAHSNIGLDNPDITGTRPAGRPLPLPAKTGTAKHSTDDALLLGRFLDGDSRPIMDKKANAFAEFRQMFVLMRLVMNQEAVNDLLARCANAPFPIVARQVLVKFRDGDSKQARNDKFDSAAFEGWDAVRPNDALVEIRGVVFLYNPADAPDTPADKIKLGSGTAPQPAKRKLGLPPLTSNN